MTISEPITAKLRDYTEDPANALKIYNFDTEYDAHDKVSKNGYIYRAKEDTAVYTTNDPRSLLVLDIDENFVKFVRCETDYTFYHVHFDKLWEFTGIATPYIVLAKWGYGFMLWDYAFPRALNDIYNPDIYGDINFPPPNTTSYRRFTLSGSTVTITDYINGTSMESPGTVDSTTTMTTTAFAIAYPGLIFFDAGTTFKSTLNGEWSVDTDSILAAAFVKQFGGSLDLADNTKWEVLSTYEPELVLDLKNYTGLWAKHQCKFSLSAEEAFDTLALGRVIADVVNVTFYDANDTAVYQVQHYEINNQRDIRNKASAYPTTIVLYAAHDNPEVLTQVIDKGRVEVEFLGESIFVGTLQLGLSMDLGVTDFQFTTSFQDFSPVEVIFNVIHYKEGLKVKDYKGTFRFWTSHFDIHDRLFVSLGGKQVIINGSDTVDNCTVDSQDRFASTMLLGRIKSMPLKTVKEDDRLGTLAQASFTIREIV